jgi:Cu+-exporting ATPase
MEGTTVDGTQTASAAASVADLEQITLTVPNMACRLCARSIEHALTNAGLTSVAVDLEEKLVVARYDPELITPEAVKKIVTDLGYTVSDLTVD